jgi:hypothetical protein
MTTSIEGGVQTTTSQTTTVGGIVSWESAVDADGHTVNVTNVDNVMGPDGSFTSGVAVQTFDTDGNMTFDTTTTKENRDGSTVQATVSGDTSSGTMTIEVTATDKDGNSSTSTWTKNADGSTTITITTTDKDGNTTTEKINTGPGTLQPDNPESIYDDPGGGVVIPVPAGGDQQNGDNGDGDNGDGENGDGENGDGEEDDADEASTPDGNTNGGATPSDDGGDEGPPGPFGVGGRIAVALLGNGAGPATPPTGTDVGSGDFDTAAEEINSIASLLRAHGGGSGPPSGSPDSGWGDSSSGESADPPDLDGLVPGRIVPSADDSGWGDLNHPNALVGFASELLGPEHVAAATQALTLAKSL